VAQGEDSTVPGDCPESGTGDDTGLDAVRGDKPPEPGPGDVGRPEGPGRILLPEASPDGGDGLRWSFDFDLESVLAEMGCPTQGGGPDGETQEEILAAELEARDRDGAVQTDLTGAVAEYLPTGPGLAAWLSQQSVGHLTDRDLPGAVAAFRRVASWAQAAELAAVAEIATRSAARDDRVGLTDDGRPVHVTRDAAGQVSLALALSTAGAESWASLAVALQWRLPRTAAALAEGHLDLYRAKVIAEATTPLSDEDARTVEDAIVPAAGDQSYAQLHNAVRRAVIAADPEGAEHRRTARERQARLSLYVDQDHTATLTGTNLPVVQSAAAWARVSSIARALKAAGAGGGIDYLRAHVHLGLLLGTLPLIPPAAGGPPDHDPPEDDPPGSSDPPPAEPPPGDEQPDDQSPDNHPLPDKPPPDKPPPDRPPGDQPPGDLPDGAPPVPPRPRGAGRGRARSPAPASSGSTGPADGRSTGAQRPGSSATNNTDITDPADGPGLPDLTDADAPEDDGYRDTPPPFAGYGYDDADDVRFWGDPLDNHHASTRPVPPWPPVPAGVPPLPGSTTLAAQPGRPPPGGLLDLTLPWSTLTGQASQPGTLGRIGPITAVQAQHLAGLAALDHQVQWRVILTDQDGHAITVGRIPRRHPRGAPGEPDAASLVGRVTVIMPAAADRSPPDQPEPGEPGGTLSVVIAAILRAADRALAQAAQTAAADQDAPGGCAHTAVSESYRPPPRTREHITARDVTCRSRHCGQPAWRGDLDHTIPWHKGGLTCTCNLGPLCRGHHQLKQHPGWTLTQTEPGTFTWTTSAGRTYTVSPDTHPS
jgi:hypothetical protein